MDRINYFEKNYPDIKWDSKPLLGNVFTALWTDYWDAPTWINWHKLLKSKFGKQRANEVFLVWWDKIPLGGPQLDYRSFNEPFRKYAKENGFYDALFPGFLGKQVKLLTSVGDLAGNVVDTGTSVVTSASDTIGWLSRNLKTLLTVLIITILISLSFYLYKKFA